MNRNFNFPIGFTAASLDRTWPFYVDCGEETRLDENGRCQECANRSEERDIEDLIVEANYIETERLGILCGDREPTQTEKDIAWTQSQNWLTEAVKELKAMR